MKIGWPLWTLATLAVGGYCLAGIVAATPTSAPFKLEPGFSVELNVLRLGTNPLALELNFLKIMGDKRPELGDYAYYGAEAEGGFWKFDNPGAAIRVIATTENLAPVVFEAMPPGSFSAGTIGRELSSSLPVERGKWRRQDVDAPQLILPRGLNSVRVEAAVVEPPLLGELVSLVIEPELRWKRGPSNLDGLFFGILFWPFLLAVQVLWAAFLVALAWSRSRERG
jgi:hypothetical protein